MKPIRDYLTEPELAAHIQRSLDEDLGSGPSAGDHSSAASLNPESEGIATLRAKESLVFAGCEVAEHVLHAVDPRLRIDWAHRDGEHLEPGTSVAHVEGPLPSLLRAERTLLNYVQRLSGVATITERYAALIADLPCRLLDTRKTTPGWRALEKWAVHVGGADNHRIGLYDMVMLKDNHIDLAGGITHAVRRTEAYLADRGLDLAIGRNEMVAIMGSSGSGKSTLMNMLGCLDRPTGGSYFLNGRDVSRMGAKELAQVRNEEIGFVFQSFQLIPTLTALENVQVPLELSGAVSAKEATSRARDLLTRVGLGDRTHHFPQQLSGGEQQRVALARAFVNEPRILFADEPTGNLDGTTGERIVELLQALNRERGCTIVLVTHDITLAARTQRTIRLRDGVVVEDIRHVPAAAPTAS